MAVRFRRNTHQREGLLCKSETQLAFCTRKRCHPLMITRDITEELIRSAAEYPVVTIVGPRQSGKTTLARMTFPDKPYSSLEDPDVRIAAEADPRGFLGQMQDGGILGEVQRLPALLSYLQGMVDQNKKRGRFILTGSHQPQLHEAISQSLAGRTAMLTLWPFSFDELSRYDLRPPPFDLIVRGCFPRLHEEKLEPRRFFNLHSAALDGDPGEFPSISTRPFRHKLRRSCRGAEAIPSAWQRAG